MTWPVYEASELTKGCRECFIYVLWLKKLDVISFMWDMRKPVR